MPYFSINLSLESVGGNESSFPTFGFSGTGIHAVLTHQGIKLSNGSEIRKARVVFRDKEHPPDFDRTTKVCKQDRTLVGVIVYSEGCAASDDRVVEETKESCELWLFLERTTLLALFGRLDDLHEMLVNFEVRGFQKDKSDSEYFDHYQWNLEEEGHTLPISDFTYEINFKKQKAPSGESEPKVFSSLRKLLR